MSLHAYYTLYSFEQVLVVGEILKVGRKLANILWIAIATNYISDANLRPVSTCNAALASWGGVLITASVLALEPHMAMEI